jgi:hypothetical protein
MLFPRWRGGTSSVPRCKKMLFCAGVVGQEPVLFDFTIEENIRMGRDGCTTEDIEKVRQTHGLIKYKDTKPQMLSLLVFNRVFILETQAVMLVFSTGFLNYCPSNLLSG